MQVRFWVVALLALFTLRAEAFDAGRVQELGRSQRWQRMLHYKKHLFTGYRSSVDGPLFFFSPEGAKDPVKELEATAHALVHRQGEKFGRLEQPPACAFPARFRFLNAELRLGLEMPDCEKWKHFLAKFNNPHSLTLVFSSAYPNNPASMFGHTFLRVNAAPKPGQEKLDLLDYGLGYAAAVGDNENPFVFAWLGLTGGYVGSFTATPYYAKVQEYSDSESRDLWEYDLDVTADQTWWLLANVWEIEVNSYFDYYFFDENCSYEILALLEVARGDWSFSDYLYHNIPAETVKRVVRTPGAVKQVKYRPSLFKKLMAYGDQLGKEDRQRFFAVIKGEGITTAPVGVLETAAAYFHYKRQRQEGQLSEGDEALLRQVLVERSKRPTEEPIKLTFDESSRPDWGHFPSRISLGQGRMKGSTGTYGWFQELGFKFAYHDLLNNDVGYVPYSEIHFPNINLRYFADEQRFWVDRLELFSIYSLSPWSWIKNSLSWTGRSAYEVPLDLCSFCHVWHVEGAVGVSQPLLNDDLRLYELVGVYAEAGKPLDRHWRAGSKFFVGVLANLTKSWKQHLEATLSSDPIKAGGEPYFASVSWGQSYFFSQSWEARLKLRSALRFRDAARGRSEGQFQFLYYF